MVEWILSASVLLIVLIAIRYLFRGKISCRLQYALWLLAALRLLVPGTVFESRASVLNVLPTVPETYEAASPVRDASEWEADAPEAASPSGLGQADRTSGMENLPAPQPETPAKRTVSRTAVLKAVWICGMAGTGLWLILGNLVFSARLKRRSVPAEVPDCPLQVFRAAGLASPCVFGLLHPRIYVSPDVLAQPDSLRHILTHELTHWRHGDCWWSCVRGLCLVIHWYNPLVWWAAALCKRDCELACDESTVKKLGEEERKAYALTLIAAMAGKPSAGQLLCTATTMNGGKRGRKERIWMLAKKRRMVWAAAAAAILLAAVAVGCTFSGTAEEVPALVFEKEEQSGTVAQVVLTRTQGAPINHFGASAQAEEIMPVAGEDFRVFRNPEEIYVHPYSEEELEEALAVAEEAAEGIGNEVGTTSFAIQTLAFDPMLTDIHVRQKIAGAPVEGWSEDDYYAHNISFALIYNSTYNHDSTFLPDAENTVIGIHLHRDTLQSAWGTEDMGAPTAEYSYAVLSQEALAQFETAGTQILAGYQPIEGEYWLYLLKLNTGKVSYQILRDFEQTPGPGQESLVRAIQSLKPEDIMEITGVLTEAETASTANGGVTAEEIAARLSGAMDHVVTRDAPSYNGIWWLEIDFAASDAGLILQAGLDENLVVITGKGSLAGESVTVEDETLYRLVRTSCDMPDLGINQQVSERYAAALEAYLADVPEAPGVTAHRELTGLALAGTCDPLHAEFYLVTDVCIAEPPEKAPVLLAGGAYLDSQLRIHGLRWKQYLVVVDGEAAGFCSYEIVKDTCENGRFQQKDELLLAIQNEG